ncbi:MAG: hypothetical protein MW690_000956 [Methanophagales archaeon]|nr:hypothetical protein [Methanophagales archaeon]
MRKFSCEKEKRARDRRQKSDETGNETERETGKGRKRREGERGRREEKKRTTTENEDLPPAAALAALRVPDASASEEPAALSPLTAPQTQNQFVILLPLLFLFRSTFFKKFPRMGQVFPISKMLKIVHLSPFASPAG